MNELQKEPLKTIVYPDIPEGDWVRCNQCGKTMLLPFGADQCPECYGAGTLSWTNEDFQEISREKIHRQGISLIYSETKLRPELYFEPETLEQEYPDYYHNLKCH